MHRHSAHSQSPSVSYTSLPSPALNHKQLNKPTADFFRVSPREVLQASQFPALQTTRSQNRTSSRPRNKFTLRHPNHQLVALLHIHPTNNILSIYDISWCYCIVHSSLNAQKTVQGISPIIAFRMGNVARAYFISHRPS